MSFSQKILNNKSGGKWTFFFNPPPLKLGKFDQNCATYGEFETYFLRFFEFAMAVGFINGNFEQKQIISTNIE